MVCVCVCVFLFFIFLFFQLLLTSTPLLYIPRSPSPACDLAAEAGQMSE